VIWRPRTIAGVIRVLVGLLVVLVVALTLLGAMLGFNLRGTADRVSKIPLQQTIWQRNNKPGTWRAAGFIILAVGVLTLALLAATLR
jgi:hypothetical protein